MELHVSRMALLALWWWCLPESAPAAVDGWMDGWMDGWIATWLAGCMDGWIDVFQGGEKERMYFSFE